MLVPEALLPQDRIISTQIRVRRERLLPAPGHVLVTQGSAVEASDVVAETQTPGPIQVLDAARTLRVPPHKVADLLQVEVGTPVQEGELLARRGGLFRRSLESPITGTLTLLDERGYLLIRAAPTRQQVQAMMRGIVVNVMSGRGVVIEGHGALLQGVWGNNQEGYGLVRLMVKAPTEAVSPGHINAGVRNTILIAGATVTERALLNAQTAQVRGVVVGSLDATLLPLASQMPFPIMLTEGFGHLPYSKPAFELLASLDGREANLNAHYTVRHGRTWPELFAPLRSEGSAISSPGTLAPGDRVRVLSEPFLGQLGTVQGISAERHTLPSGISVLACEVRLDKGAALLVPYPNLERLLQ